MGSHGGSRDDIIRCNCFLRHEICKKSLAHVQKKDATNYINGRLKLVGAGTVRREVNLWVQVFETAREEYETLVNIFADRTIRGGKRRRTRRLIEEEHELERLEK